MLKDSKGIVLIKKQQVYNLEEKIPLQLLIVNLFKSHTSYLRKTLKNTEITLGQFPVLVETHKHNTISQKELADILYLSEGTVSKVIKQLEDKKIIEHEVNPENRRQNKISLTEKGKKIANEVKYTEKNWEKKVIEEIPEEEREIFFNNLEKVMYKAIDYSYLKE